MASVAESVLLVEVSVSGCIVGLRSMASVTSSRSCSTGTTEVPAEPPGDRPREPRDGHRHPTAPRRAGPWAAATCDPRLHNHP